MQWFYPLSVLVTSLRFVFEDMHEITANDKTMAFYTCTAQLLLVVFTAVK